MVRMKVIIDGDERELPYPAHGLICNSLADTYNKYERKYDRLKRKDRYYIEPLSGESVPASREMDTTLKMMENISKIMRILKC